MRPPVATVARMSDALKEEATPASRRSKRQKRRRRMFFAALSAAVALAVAAPVVWATTDIGSGDSTGPRVKVSQGAKDPSNHFYIVGSDIVAPDGHKFYPIGANVGMTSNFDWEGTGEGHVADAVAWGWNTVRLTIYCTPAYSFSIWKAAGYDALWAKVDAFVQEYTGQGLVVMIECHDAAADRAAADRFWKDAATRYRDNQYVWFNPENEPTWNDNVEWLRLQKHYLDLIRSTGSENIFVADVQNSGNDAGWDGAKPVDSESMGPELVKGQCNVLFSHHEYGGVDDSIGAAKYWDNVHDAGLAMIVGEFGYKLAPGDDPSGYAQHVRGADSVFDIAPSKGIGMLWWHATHGDGFSLKANGKAFYDGGPSANLSPGGQRLWDIGHNPPDLGAFTGDLRRSNCTSAPARLIDCKLDAQNPRVGEGIVGLRPTSTVGLDAERRPRGPRSRSPRARRRARGHRSCTTRPPMSTCTRSGRSS